MAHPLIEHAERTLAETGFRVQRVAGTPQLPGDQLLISIASDPQGRDRLILLTLYEGLADEIDDAHLLQYFVRMPFEVATEQRDELARFLNLVNVRLPLGAYGFLFNGMVFFRAMAMLTVDTSTWTKLVSEYLFITVFALDAFAEGVEAVATGRMTALEASEADPRLDPLDE
jgi:hypothetical protein